MIRDVLQAIGGIEIYPVISLILFMLSFGAVVVWAILQDRHKLQRLSRLPLDDAAETTRVRSTQSMGDM